LDAFLDLFGKGVVLIVILFMLIALCLLVCGVALSPFISVLYLVADWYERKKLKEVFSDTQRVLQTKDESSLGECSKIRDN